MLAIHISLAILSLIWATIAFFTPSTSKLHISYVFTGSVVLTGVLLVLMNHAVIMHVCTSGITYLALSTTVTVLTRRKLALEQIK